MHFERSSGMHRKGPFFLKCDKKLIFDRVSHQFEMEMESHIDIMLEINRRQWFWHGVDSPWPTKQFSSKNINFKSPKIDFV